MWKTAGWSGIMGKNLHSRLIHVHACRVSKIDRRKRNRNEFSTFYCNMSFCLYLNGHPCNHHSYARLMIIGHLSCSQLFFQLVFFNSFLFVKISQPENMDGHNRGGKGGKAESGKGKKSAN